MFKQIDSSEIRSVVNRQMKNRISSKIVNTQTKEKIIHKSLSLLEKPLFSSGPSLFGSPYQLLSVTSVGRQTVDLPATMQERFQVKLVRISNVRVGGPNVTAAPILKTDSSFTPALVCTTWGQIPVTFG